MTGSLGSKECGDEAIITAAYRSILGREPDVNGLRQYADALRAGKDLAWLLDAFVRSDEFRAKASTVVPAYPLDGAPPLDIELELSNEDKRTLWRHVSRVWTRLGGEDPYWSVLSAERWRKDAMTKADAIADFYATGEQAVARVDQWLARNRVALSADGVCSEFGCGVGRVTEWLARRFRLVRAFDISATHLAAARERLSGLGIRNVEWVLVRGQEDLRHLQGTAFFYSIIVLQHNPPPLIADVLDAALAGLQDDALAFFQVPTYAKGYRFGVQAYLEGLAQQTGIEMHLLPQKAIFDAAARSWCKVLEVQPDWLVGYPDSWISNTFLMKKCETAGMPLHLDGAVRPEGSGE